MLGRRGIGDRADEALIRFRPAQQGDRADFAGLCSQTATCRRQLGVRAPCRALAEFRGKVAEAAPEQVVLDALLER